MNQKTLAKLEFDKIISLLEEEAGSFRGRQLCHRLKPMTNLEKINTFQEQTAAAFTRIVRKGRISFGDAAPVEESMKRLEIGGALSISELLRICRLLANTARVKSYGRHDTQEDSADCLDAYFDQLEPLTPLTSEIERCIISEDEISDDASSTLKHIRRSIGSINDKVHSTLSGLVNGSLRTYLQDPIITMRGDRYCIPVKAEYRGQVQGLIHDQSSTGSTLFIEPMAVVKLNNDLKELYAKEQEEIQAILARLSEEAAQYIEEIRADYRALTDLDFIFARGALALSMRGSRPVFNEEGRIRIREGRHPLLDQKSVVPITVSLGEDFTLLIITGPNTGGKTVSLKTVGLFTLMGQAGLHIPAGDRSELAVFHQVYADIGDEQSIEQSLSTFSSHMTNIVSFLKKVDERSLVLFDELGAGTDPTEGAALAIAILSHLHKRNIRTMATTHYSELKVYALSTPGVENACCEFDVESLRPTYRLLIGIPGKSNAFAISSKLGLPDYIIDDAKQRLSEQDVSFEDLLSDLETSRRTIEKEREEIAAYRREAESLKEQAAQRQAKLDEQRDRIIREANEKANAILREAKEVADETIRNFHKFGKENISAAEMEKERERLRKKIKDTSSASSLGSQKPKKTHKPSDFKLGESVKVLSMNLTGTVSSLPDSRGNVTVQMGILRSQVNISDLEFDVESLRPTYRLLIGIPGKSNAFAISSKLGLPDYIIDDAKQRLSEQDVSFEDLLSDLETSRRTIEKEREEIAAYRREAESLKEQAAQRQAKLDEQRDRIIREANEKANAILREAKEVADETIRNFHKFGKENISAAEMEKERERLRKKIKDTSSASSLGSQKPKKTHKPSDFKLGESVKVLSMNLTGTVSSLPDSRGNVTVQMGILRSQVNISDLEIIEEPSPYTAKKFSRTSKGKIAMGKSLSVSPEINLLGRTVDEAVSELDKYLDDALLSHLNTVRVVHGKGTGALRKGIHEYLRRQKHVKSYRLAEFGEGDAGVTIVELG